MDIDSENVEFLSIPYLRDLDHEGNYICEVITQIGKKWPKIYQKCQKTGSGQFWCYQMWISQKSPNFHYLTVTFGFFDQFLANPHLVARKNRTI